MTFPLAIVDDSIVVVFCAIAKFEDNKAVVVIIGIMDKRMIMDGIIPVEEEGEEENDRTIILFVSLSFILLKKALNSFIALNSILLPENTY
jgi:hypothetical protein